MPFHKNRFCSSIEDRIKHSEMNNVEKQILYSALEKVEESGYLDSYSLHDFEEILEALYKTKAQFMRTIILNSDC